MDESKKEGRVGFKTGVLIGFGVGYVFGAKAGRQRYEEIRQGWDRFMGNPNVQRMAEKGKDVVETGKDRGLQAVEQGVSKASGAIKDKLESGGEGDKGGGR